MEKGKEGLSARAVQSVATRMIADREKEIEAFKAEEFWQIKLSAVSSQQTAFWVELMKVVGRMRRLTMAKRQIN